MLSYIIKPYTDLSKDELYKILKLRQEVFVVEQNCPYLDVDGMDQRAIHVLGIDKENNIGAYARIIHNVENRSEEIKIGRVLTSESFRGKGIGRSLMKETIQYSKQRWPAKNIVLSAQSYLLNFYQSLGFKKVGSEYLEDGIPHRAMILN